MWFRKFLRVPTKEVNPTINKEYAVAVTGIIFNTYTNTGTVRIDPPAPVKPKTIPITTAQRTP